MKRAEDRAELPADPDQTFPRTCRLTLSRQFRDVFAAPRRRGGAGFLVLYRKNNLGHPRLGLAIARSARAGLSTEPV
ncbi:MAG: hypothetical protein HC834_07830 [Rhodospirillales bacterium]|nr:hypothetical protein [Rhodospirillales bacterium]